MVGAAHKISERALLVLEVCISVVARGGYPSLSLNLPSGSHRDDGVDGWRWGEAARLPRAVASSSLPWTAGPTDAGRNMCCKQVVAEDEPWIREPRRGWHRERRRRWPVVEEVGWRCWWMVLSAVVSTSLAGGSALAFGTLGTMGDGHRGGAVMFVHYSTGANLLPLRSFGICRPSQAKPVKQYWRDLEMLYRSSYGVTLLSHGHWGRK